MLEAVLVVRGRQIYPWDLIVIKETVESHADGGVQAIALALCERWSWRQAGGNFNVGGAVRVLLAAEYRGLVQLPAVRKCTVARDGSLAPALDMSPISGCLSDLSPVELSIATDGAEASLFQYILAHFHYLGARRVIGKHLCYLARSGGRPLGALLWGRAALKIGVRDEAIGWTAQERRLGLDSIACNYRFLILPWVRVPHLASHVLAKNVRSLSQDWLSICGSELRYLETFVDPELFDATSYIAANWICVGETSGSGRRGPLYHYHGHRKKVLLYAMDPDVRRRWTHELRSSTSQDNVASSLQVVLPNPHCIEGEMATVNKPAMEDFLEGLDARDVRNLAQELSQYCNRFSDLFPRSELRAHFELTMSGLMSPLEKKNIEFMALRGGDNVPVRTLQHFLTGSTWDDEALRIRHQNFVASTLGHPEGYYIVDESGFAKKGADSAGVARQYCGSLGKVDNCQVGVFVAYASPNGGGSTLVDTRLYVPKSWFDEDQKANRWESCHIPTDLHFRTKPELALEMVHQLVARNALTAKWVLADAVYGDNAAFLDGLPQSLQYFCQVSKSTRAWVEDEQLSMKEVAEHPAVHWQRNVVLKEGVKGVIFADVARIRVVGVRHEHGHQVRGNAVWAFFRRLPETGEIKYYLSNAPEDIPMESMNWLSCMRWPIETCFQESKDHLGMDHYQVRTWRAWYRHMTLVMLSHHFLLYLRGRLKKN